MGDRLAIMDRGRVLQVGTYHEVYDHPANAFVAGFLGLPPMNLLDGTIDGQYVVVNNERLPCPSQLQQRLTQGQRVIAGIRPEVMRVLADGESAPAGAGRLTARFDLAERLHAERAQLLHAEFAGKRLVVRAPIDQDVPLRELLSVTLPAESIQLFDAETQARI